MDGEREAVAPAREEPAADTRTPDGEALGRIAPARNGARGGPRVAWAPADVAALQRAAGNAAVARLLARGNGSQAPVTGRARGVIQRDINTKPEDIKENRGPEGLRDYLKGLKQYLGLYRKASAADKLVYLPLMLSAVTEWLKRYRENPGGETGKEAVKSYKLEQQLAALRGEIYVESVELNALRYASFESQGQARNTRKLMAGTTSAAPGMGLVALQLIQGAGLTEAETLAIKVYSVGDYRAINKTLQQADISQQGAATVARYDKELTRALQEMGLVKGLVMGTMVPIPPPEILAAKGAFQQGSPQWKKQEALFNQYAPTFTPNLEQAREEALLHTDMLKAAFRRMGGAFAFDSARKGNTWRGMRLDPTWAIYKSYLTKQRVIDVDFFCSTSQEPAEAMKFAETKTKDGREGFFAECVLKDGRDISMFSEHPNEKEVLVLPGAKLQVKDVRRATDPLVVAKLQKLLPGQRTSFDWYVLLEEQ